MRNTQEKHLPRKTYVLERNSDKEEGALFRCQKNAASFITHQSAIPGRNNPGRRQEKGFHLDTWDTTYNDGWQGGGQWLGMVKAEGVWKWCSHIMCAMKHYKYILKIWMWRPARHQYIQYYYARHLILISNNRALMHINKKIGIRTYVVIGLDCVVQAKWKRQSGKRLR